MINCILLVMHFVPIKFYDQPYNIICNLFFFLEINILSIEQIKYIIWVIFVTINYHLNPKNIVLYIKKIHIKLVNFSLQTTYRLMYSLWGFMHAAYIYQFNQFNVVSLRCMGPLPHETTTYKLQFMSFMYSAGGSYLIVQRNEQYDNKCQSTLCPYT